MPNRHSMFAAVGALVLVALAPAARAAETAVERGKNLVDGIAACSNCHTPKGPDGKAIADMALSGGNPINSPTFRAFPSNITPDKETGIGAWSDRQIVDAIRNGKRPDGTSIGPPMPIEFYRDMSDSDALAIVAYLRSAKPIKHQVEMTTRKAPVPDYGPAVEHVADVPRTDRIAYGKYVATALGHCMDCHTPNVNGLHDFTRMGGGGIRIAAQGGFVTPPNLTPGNPNGIVTWTDAQVKTAITTGMAPDRPLVRAMAFDWYKNISPDDLDALVAFLRALKPVPNP